MIAYRSIRRISRLRSGDYSYGFHKWDLTYFFLLFILFLRDNKVITNEDGLQFDIDYGVVNRLTGVTLERGVSLEDKCRDLFVLFHSFTWISQYKSPTKYHIDLSTLPEPKKGRPRRVVHFGYTFVKRNIAEMLGKIKILSPNIRFYFHETGESDSSVLARMHLTLDPSIIIILFNMDPREIPDEFTVTNVSLSVETKNCLHLIWSFLYCIGDHDTSLRSLGSSEQIYLRTRSPACTKGGITINLQKSVDFMQLFSSYKNVFEAVHFLVYSKQHSQMFIDIITKNFPEVCHPHVGGLFPREYSYMTGSEKFLAKLYFLMIFDACQILNEVCVTIHSNLVPCLPVILPKTSETKKVVLEKHKSREIDRWIYNLTGLCKVENDPMLQEYYKKITPKGDKLSLLKDLDPKAIPRDSKCFIIDILHQVWFRLGNSVTK